MKTYFCLLLTLAGFSSYGYTVDKMEVILPYMDRPASHRAYGDELLKLALQLSTEKYGAYHITQQYEEAVVGRQLLQLQKKGYLSVATAMPTQEWLEQTIRVPFPIMKGLASYRMFLTHSMHLSALQHIQSMSDLKRLTIGQGIGWSTAEILEKNGFKVIYGVKYTLLFPMLYANRFDLLMRSIYEVEPEWQTYRVDMPELRIADDFVLYTYLPMYFFVNKHQPKLAERLLYGLKLAADNGQLDALFQHYFADVLALLNKQARKVFYLQNNNIDPSFFKQDKPYLLKKISDLQLNSQMQLSHTAANKHRKGAE